MLLKKTILFILLAVSLYATTATQENVTKLYVATFNRAPDSAGLYYWVNNSGLSLENIAQSFFDQPEAKEKYPDGSTNSTFIDSIYSNLFNRTSDTDGFNYWKAELDAGRIEKSVFILAVVNGAQDSDADILSNKTDVGLSFAEAGLSDTATAKDIMTNVTHDTATITSALDSFSVTLSSNAVFKNTSPCPEGQMLYENYMGFGSDECFDDPNAEAVEEETIISNPTGLESSVDGWYAPSKSDCESNGGSIPYDGSKCIATLANAKQVCSASAGRLATSDEYASLILGCGAEINIVSSSDSDIQDCYKSFGFIDTFYYWTSTESTSASNGITALLSTGNSSSSVSADFTDGVQCKITSSTSSNASITTIEYDDGNTISTATQITSNMIMSSININDIEDIDYFKVELTSSGTITLSTTGSTDTYGYLYNSEGILLLSDNNSGSNNNFEISTTINVGTYYVGVRGNENAIGVYSLVSSFEEETSSLTTQSNGSSNIYQVIDYKIKNNNISDAHNVKLFSDSSGIYITGYNISSSGRRAFVSIYSLDGVYKWRKYADTTSYDAYVSTDSLGYVYISMDSELYKFKSLSTGFQQIWSKDLDPYSTGVSIDNNDYVYTTNYQNITKFDADGNEISKSAYFSAVLGGYNDNGREYASDTQGNFFYLYSVNGQVYLRKISPIDGLVMKIPINNISEYANIQVKNNYLYFGSSTIYKYTLDGEYIQSYDVFDANTEYYFNWTVNNNGEIFVIGTNSNSQDHITLKKISSSGIKEWETLYFIDDIKKFSLYYNESDNRLLIGGSTKKSLTIANDESPSAYPFVITFKESTIPETNTDIIPSSSTSSDITVSNNNPTGVYRMVEISDTATEFTPSLSKDENIRNAEILAEEKVDNDCTSTGGQPGIPNFSTVGCVSSTLLDETLYYCEARATIACTYYNP